MRFFLKQTLKLLQRPLVKQILSDLYAEIGRTPELAATARTGIQEDRRELGEQSLDRAVARGELGAGIDRALALDLLVAPLYWRATVTGGPTSPDYLGALTNLTLGGLQALSTAMALDDQRATDNIPETPSWTTPLRVVLAQTR